MKILSINIWNINEPLKLRMNILEKFIAKEMPDGICFQEVSKINGVIQIKSILERFNYKYTYCISGYWKGREEGLVIATQKEHKLILCENLPFAVGDMNRILMGVSLENKDVGKIYLFNTHLSYYWDKNQERLQQAKSIIKYISSNCEKQSNIILCGDFNEDPNQGELHEFLKNNSCYRLASDYADIGNTFSAENPYTHVELWPNRQIDFIYRSVDLYSKTKLVMTHNDDFGCCSDHYGVFSCIKKGHIGG